jgi:hypothetical protein
VFRTPSALPGTIRHQHGGNAVQANTNRQPPVIGNSQTRPPTDQKVGGSSPSGCAGQRPLAIITRGLFRFWEPFREPPAQAAPFLRDRLPLGLPSRALVMLTVAARRSPSRMEADRFRRQLNYAVLAIAVSNPSSYSDGVR